MDTGNMLLRHVIRCQYSGLPIGILEVQTTAGALPYLSHWHKALAYHPLFSLSTDRLLKFVKEEWDRLRKRAIDEEITEAESNILCCGFLAMLHNLDCIVQETPSLPPLAIVQTNINKLFALSYWKWHLESQRFTFPTLKISRFNKNDGFANIPDYLELCFQVKKDYETKVNTALEKAKIDSANKALALLADTWIAPPNKKVLWQWVRAHLPEKWSADAQGWMSTIFLGGNHAIWDFSEEEIDLMEEIITSECPVGNGIMYAVRQRMKSIREIWEQKHAAYEIDLGDYGVNNKLYVNGIPVAAPDPGPEPMQRDFTSRAKYLVTHAKWSIAKAAWNKQHSGDGTGEKK